MPDPSELRGHVGNKLAHPWRRDRLPLRPLPPAASEVQPAAPEPAEDEAQPGGVLERRDDVTMDVYLDPVGVHEFVRGRVLRNLERPDRAAFDPSSAVHDRLERNAQHPAPGTDVIPHFRGLEVSLTHASSMPQAGLNRGGVAAESVAAHPPGALRRDLRPSGTLRLGTQFDGWGAP